MFPYGSLHMDMPVLVDQQQLCMDTECSLKKTAGSDGW